MIQIKVLANIDSATWPDKFVKTYLNNYLSGEDNKDCNGKLVSEVFVFETQGNSKDIEANAPYLVTLVSFKLPTYLQN